MEDNHGDSPTDNRAETQAGSGPVRFNVLLYDADFIAIEKPAGFHVHQPEDSRRRVPRELTCLPNLRAQIENYLYPVHRLDVGTDGVLVFALNKESAASMCRQFGNGLVKKSYYAIVRGWSDDEGVIDVPLDLDSTGSPVEALTRYRTRARTELNVAIGKRHPTARFSLVEAFPETGRFHQVRRHLARLAHPLVGDRLHGDSHQNRFFREHLAAPGLWLKAKTIEFAHPMSGERIRIESAWSQRWLDLFPKLGFEEPSSTFAEDL
jgi:tRNA pseudouridine65 synthase